MTDSDKDLQILNLQVLNLLQAMIGSITPNLRRVALGVLGPRKVHVYFAIERDLPEDREEIDDIVFEFEALQTGEIEIDVTILVGAGAGPIKQMTDLTKSPAWRAVYARKEISGR